MVVIFVIVGDYFVVRMCVVGILIVCGLLIFWFDLLLVCLFCDVGFQIVLVWYEGGVGYLVDGFVCVFGKFVVVFVVGFGVINVISVVVNVLVNQVLMFILIGEVVVGEFGLYLQQDMSDDGLGLGVIFCWFCCCLVFIELIVNVCSKIDLVFWVLVSIFCGLVYIVLLCDLVDEWLLVY